MTLIRLVKKMIITKEKPKKMTILTGKNSPFQSKILSEDLQLLLSLIMCNYENIRENVYCLLENRPIAFK